MKWYIVKSGSHTRPWHNQHIRFRFLSACPATNVFNALKQTIHQYPWACSKVASDSSLREVLIAKTLTVLGIYQVNDFFR